MDNIQIYDKMWVCCQPTREELGDAPIAYLCQVDKGLKKRQTTGRYWATPHSVWDPKLKKSVPCKDKPIEWEFENEWMIGFKILQSKSRYSTSNVVWRVLDPRGFQLEIYSGNMMQLMKHCTIEKGMIASECVWGREGGKNVLIPRGSELEKKAGTHATRVANKLKAREVEPGDIMHTINGNKRVVYLGKLYEFQKTWDGSRKQGNSVEYRLVAKKPKHVYANLKPDGTPDYSNLMNQGQQLKMHTKDGSIPVLTGATLVKRLFHEIQKRDYLWTLWMEQADSIPEDYGYKCTWDIRTDPVYKRYKQYNAVLTLI
jgi:hypothetical protein